MVNHTIGLSNEAVDDAVIWLASTYVFIPTLLSDSQVSIFLVIHGL